MGKGGGKGGKSGLGKALGLVGAVAGFAFPGMFGISSGLLWVQRTAGAIMGLSLGQTIGSALDPIDQETKTSSFDSKMNTVDSDARIPLVYGTRMIGGLQSWHQTNSDDKWLIKDVILGEGVISFEVAFFDGKLVVAHGKIVFPPASFIKGRQLDIV